MINFHYLWCIILLSVISLTTDAQKITIDQWMQLSHPFSSKHLQSSVNYLWWSSPNAIFNYHPISQELTEFNKSNRLSDADIQSFLIHPEKNIIIVIYKSGRIDLIDDDQTHSIYDWEINSSFQNKLVKDVNFMGDKALITTSNYLFILDINNKTFENSIPLENALNSFYYNDTLVVSSPYQLNLISRSVNKTYIHPYPNAVNLNNHIFLYDSTSVSEFNDKLDTVFIHPSEKILQAKTIHNQLYILTNNHTKNTIYQYIPNQSTFDSITSFTYEPNLNDFTLFNNKWYGLNDNGLLHIQNEAVILFSFIYPKKYPIKNIASNNNAITLYDEYKTYNVNTNQVWTKIYEDSIQNILSNEFSVYYLFTNDSIRKHSSTQTIQLKYPFSERILASFLNIQNELVILTDSFEENVWILSSELTWSSNKITIPTNYKILSFYIDHFNNFWLSFENEGLLMFQLNRTISQSDDVIKQFEKSISITNILSNNIYSIISDNEGILWVGSDDGIFYLPCSHQIGSITNCSFSAPIFSNDNVGYRILAGEKINDIKIDGANRKWIATNNGLFLLDAKVSSTLHHFNVNNSDLISNKINSITIIQKEGYIVLNTELGISILKQSAEKLETEKINISVYPNPASISQHSFVAIRKIPENSTVKILSINGQLIKVLKSTGSQAVWYYKNDKITTGVYIALIIDESKNKYFQTKLLITP